VSRTSSFSPKSSISVPSCSLDSFLERGIIGSVRQRRWRSQRVVCTSFCWEAFGRPAPVGEEAGRGSTGNVARVALGPAAPSGGGCHWALGARMLSDLQVRDLRVLGSPSLRRVRLPEPGTLLR
jgi:hypothetical protein